MTEKQPFDLIHFSRRMAEALDRAYPILIETLQQKKMPQPPSSDTPFDPLRLRHAGAEFWAYAMRNPSKIAEWQMTWWQDFGRIVQNSTQRFLGSNPETLFEPERSDRRFRDPVWSDNVMFDALKQSYLMTGKWIQDVIHNVDGLSPADRRRVEFISRQIIDAFAPTNFAITNPEVLKAALETGGETLINGFENFVEDLQKGKISTTRNELFEVGRNLATTPGDVIFENKLIQLIQYKPTTKTVAQTPLLIVPPWINKFYILDLRPENSFIRWALDQGQTVFIISWANPDESFATISFEDYMKLGILEALDAIEKATGETQTNVIGYCIGGTLLSITLSWLTAKKQQNRVKSATFFTTLLDFEDAGDLTIFTSDDQIAAMTEKMKQLGYLDSKSMQTTFNLLRANDLIWSFVINNYLLGKDPFPFDLLFWNEDSTNLPAAMQNFYLTKMYRDNLLIQPNGLKIDGINIDLSEIKQPSYFLSTRDDHIAPWHCTYKSAQALKNADVTFTLSGSGHIAGVINPPDANKYGFWVCPALKKSAEDWLKHAQPEQGSWWPHWMAWIKPYLGKQVPARQPENSIEPAPGRYVQKQGL